MLKNNEISLQDIKTRVKKRVLKTVSILRPKHEKLGRIIGKFGSFGIEMDNPCS